MKAKGNVISTGAFACASGSECEVERPCAFSEPKRTLKGYTKLGTIVLAGFLCFAVSSAFAQGCVMCYTTTAASPKDVQSAISRAVILLLVPPVGMMTIGVGLAFRYGRKRDLEQDSSATESE